MISQRPQVLLADDDIRILTAFERLLSPSCDVVGRVTRVDELFEAVTRLRPTVIVLDLRMPAHSGFNMCRHLKQVWPDAKIVIVSGVVDESQREGALRAGASAFISKMEAAHELLPAIQNAAESP